MRRERKKPLGEDDEGGGDDNQNFSYFSQGTFSDGEESESTPLRQAFRVSHPRRSSPGLSRPIRGRSLSSSHSRNLTATLSLDGITESAFEGIATPKRATELEEEAVEEEEVQPEEDLTQSIWSIMSVGGERPKQGHHRWASDGGRRVSEEAGLLENDLKTRVVLVEKLRPVEGTAFFSGW